MSREINRKQLANKFILREGYLKKQFFEDAIEEKILEFKTRFPECIIDVKKNEKGARIIVYQKTK